MAEAAKVWSHGRWYYDIVHNSWKYVATGAYDPAVAFSSDDIQHTLDARTVEQLIRALDEEGWIMPRLDERLREGDLKIIHRLLNLLEIAARKS